jgi:hypothetical protein
MRSESTILRVDKQAGRWEAVPVALITDERLGFDTRGFAVWLVSKPDGWEIRAGALPYLLKDRTAPWGHVGRDKARRFMRELERAGYLARTRTRRPDGRWVWRSVFTSSSPTIDALAVDGSAVDGSSVDGKGVDLYQTLNYIRRIQSTLNYTTAGPAQETVGPTKETVFPTVLSGAYRAPARTLIADCPPEQRQAVLDEVAALHDRGALRGSPIGLLHRLVERANDGTFTPSYAVSYREKHRREAIERARPFEQRKQGSASAPVHAAKTADRVMSALRAKRKSSESL